MKAKIAVVCDSGQWPRACEVVRRLPGEPILISLPAIGFENLNLIADKLGKAKVTHCVIIPDGIIGGIISSLRALLTQLEITSDVAQPQTVEVTLRDNTIEELLEIIMTNESPELVIQLTSRDGSYVGKAVVMQVGLTWFVAVALRREQSKGYKVICRERDLFAEMLRQESLAPAVLMEGQGDVVFALVSLLRDHGQNIASEHDLEVWLKQEFTKRRQLVRKPALVR